MVDHFSLAGARAATDFWESDIFSTNILSELRSTDYVARMQFLLQQGVSKHDVALFRRNGAVNNNYVAPYFTSTSAKLGWIANYVDPGLFKLPTATVKKGRFAPSAADYSLLVIPGDPDADNGPTLTASTAKRVLGFRFFLLETGQMLAHIALAA